MIKTICMTMMFDFKLTTYFTCSYFPGFNVETVEHKNISFTAWDVGGRDKMVSIV